VIESTRARESERERERESESERARGRERERGREGMRERERERARERETCVTPCSCTASWRSLCASPPLPWPSSLSHIFSCAPLTGHCCSKSAGNSSFFHDGDLKPSVHAGVQIYTCIYVHKYTQTHANTTYHIPCTLTHARVCVCMSAGKCVLKCRNELWEWRIGNYKSRSCAARCVYVHICE